MPRTNSFMGIDLGIKEFYTDSNGDVVSNPRYLRKSPLRLKRRHRRKSARAKGGKNRHSNSSMSNCQTVLDRDTTL
ncbi:MAG: transposase [Symploca sp. SIO3C6]|nr:transposase [Symploca sp. SIO3C6]